MIFANINQNLPYLPENVKECLEFAKKNDLLSFEPGSHEIDGKRLSAPQKGLNIVVMSDGSKRKVLVK